MKFELLGKPILWQWDQERFIKMIPEDGEPVDYIDFANICCMKEALRMEPKRTESNDLIAEIPRQLLTAPGILHIYPVVRTENGEQTTDFDGISISKKEKPKDYVNSETEVFSYRKLSEEMLKQMKELDKKIADTNKVYNVTNYGISTDAEDNTLALQKLVDLVHENGGGTIYFPAGVYAFKKTEVTANDANNSAYAILAKSNVSIVGENLRQTILKQVGGTPYSLFYNHATPDNPIVGCRYSNFTIDAYDTGDVNAVYGKAFYYQYVRDCIFRDLLLRGTVATAMGIDYLDRVQIEFVNTVDCGRTFTGIEGGSSGIGIGTGGWENENFFIHNCICKGSGQYGIFIENQYNLGWGGTTDLSKGCIISNCITQGGLNKGIGIRGGQNVTVIGCESYENATDGIFVDGKCKNVKVISCNTANNGGNGIKVATTQESEKVIVQGNMVDSNTLDGILLSPTASVADMVVKENTVIDNVQNGIHVASDVDGMVLMENYVKGSDKALSVGEHTYADAVIKNNVFFGDVANAGTFTGNTSFNDLFGITDTAFETITVLNTAFTKGYKLDTEGVETASEASGISGYLDVSSVSKVKVRYSLLDLSKGAAIVEFDENKTFLKRTVQFDNTQAEPVKTDYDVALELDSNTRYIRISLNELNDTYCTVEEYE